jgi:hypothetical protein
VSCNDAGALRSGPIENLFKILGQSLANQQLGLTGESMQVAQSFLRMLLPTRILLQALCRLHEGRIRRNRRVV